MFPENYIKTYWQKGFPFREYQNWHICLELQFIILEVIVNFLLRDKSAQCCHIMHTIWVQLSWFQASFIKDQVCVSTKLQYTTQQSIAIIILPAIISTY